MKKLYWFENLNPVIQALVGTTFTWGVTALGALVVCFFRKMNGKVLDTILGFSAGVMIAASFWSLLAPSLDLSEELGYIVWLLPTLGFICGGMFVLLSDRFLDKMLKVKSDLRSVNSLKRSILLISAITIHNIPEGMAVGVAFGGIASGVALPLRREGYSRLKSFMIGQASALVEPLAAVIGAILVMYIRSMLPFLLAFAAGAMIIVVARELLPESVKEHKNLSTVGVILGFILMMVLDVALG